MRPWIALLFVLATDLAPAAPPVSGARPPQSAARGVGCLIEPERVADIGSQVIGLVERVHVERGDSVRAGQELVSLRADVERANAAVARTRAQVESDLAAARTSLDLAEQKVRRAEALVAQNFISPQSLDQSRGEAELARQKVLQAQSQQKIWAQEQMLAEAQLGLRRVRSPLSGVVVERFVNPGERVEQQAMLRIAVVNTLRVELLVPTSLYGRLAKGDQVTVQPELPGAQAVQAVVRHVDKVLDAASNSFRVRLSLPNPDGKLPAGLRCSASVPGAESLPPPEAAPTPAPVTRPKLAPASHHAPTPGAGKPSL